MTFTYDSKLNVAYICFADRSELVNSHVIDDDTVVDVDPSGKVYGVEFLSAREQLNPSKGKFQFANPVTHEQHEVLLPVI